MAEVEEQQFTSLSDRIAALKQSQARDSNGATTTGKRPPPPRPALDIQRPQVNPRSKTINNPPISAFKASVVKQNDNERVGTRPNGILPPPSIDRDLPKQSLPLPSRTGPPPLPSRKSSHQLSPNLPPRSSSAQLVVRRGSDDSLVSQSSTISNLSTNTSLRSSTSSVDTCTGRKLPPALNQASLPPLPPTRREIEEKANQERQTRASIASVKSSPAIPLIEWKKPTVAETPPSLPTRPRQSTPAVEDAVSVPVRRKLPPDVTPPLPQRPSTTSRVNISSTEGNIPPPIPYASRPSQKQIGARKSPPDSVPKNECLLCRDFSGPDRLGAQYPRQSNPNMSTKYLARVLCDPFDSPTDKARAILSWLHHNIDYDTDSFFRKAVKHSTPENTIARGLAVCGGYAGLYEDIALQAGLECRMVTGHGKGYGYSRGSSIPPPDPTGHAWNAVRIDGGEWKLIDPCWAAGHVNDQQRYVRKFSPENFTSSNEEFGEKHFPQDNRYFYRQDGRALTWEEYIVGPYSYEPPQVLSITEEYGIGKRSFLPAQRDIKVKASGTTRFQFSNICPHWDHIKNGSGDPYCMILKINGLDGKESDFVAFDYDGTHWWADVVTKHLGTAPQKVHVYSVTTVNDKDARGMTKAEYLSRKGKPGSMAFGIVATWDLV